MIAWLLAVSALMLAIGLLMGLANRDGAEQVVKGDRPRPSRTGRAMQVPHVPAGCFLDPGHSWMRICSDGSMAVGMDAFLAEALGEVEFVELPSPGSWIRRGDVLLRVVAGGRALRLHAPVTGEVRRVNNALKEEPWRLVSDPYGAGWAVGIWARNHQRAIRPLKIGPAAASYLLAELKHLVDFLPGPGEGYASPLRADGAMPVAGAVCLLDDWRWSLFQREFLDPEQAGDGAEPSKLTRIAAAVAGPDDEA